MFRRRIQRRVVGGAVLSLFLLFAVFGVVGCFSESSREGSADKSGPNFIILSIDTLNRSSLRAYDPEAPAHPNIDRFSESAFVFRRAHSTASWTLPAQASLLTGLYSNRHGGTMSRARLFSGLPHLAKELEAAGYDTLAFTDGGYLSRRYGFGVGFDRYDDALGENQQIAEWIEKLSLPRRGKVDGTQAAPTFDRAIAALRQRAAKAPPFFLFLQTYLVHDYFLGRPHALEILNSTEQIEGDESLGCLVGLQHCSQGEWEFLQTLYFAEIEHLDRGVGALFETLEVIDELDSTVVVFVSDHGEGFEPRRRRIHHGGRLHSDLISIPMMIVGPGVSAGETDAVVSLVDVMPTLLEIAGQTPPEDIDGVSLLPLIRGETSASDRTVYASEFNYVWIDGKRVDASAILETPAIVAAISDDFWYIESPTRRELYGVLGDPDQKKNLVGRRDVVAEMKRRLDSTDHRRNPESGSSEEVEIDEALKRRLKNLGYIQ